MSKKIIEELGLNIDPQDYEDISIEQLFIDPKIRDILMRIEICTVEQLLNTSSSTILSIKGVGSTKYKRLISCLLNFIEYKEIQAHNDYDDCDCDECPKNLIKNSEAAINIEKKVNDNEWGVSLAGDFESLSSGLSYGIKTICSIDEQINVPQLMSFAHIFSNLTQDEDFSPFGFITYSKIYSDSEVSILKTYQSEFSEMILKIIRKYHSVLSGFLANYPSIVKDVAGILLNVMCLYTIGELCGERFPDLMESVEQLGDDLRDDFLCRNYSFADNYDFQFNDSVFEQELYKGIFDNIKRCPEYSCCFDERALPVRFAEQMIELIDNPMMIEDSYNGKDFEVNDLEMHSPEKVMILKTLTSYYQAIISTVNEFLIYYMAFKCKMNYVNGLDPFDEEEDFC